MIVTLLLLIAGIILALLILLHLYFRVPVSKAFKTPADYDLPFKELSIQTLRQKQLYAWFIPTQVKAALVVIVHGWGSNAAKVLPLAVPFYQQGLNVLLFDARSHGRSDRDTFSSLPRFAEDIQQVIRFARKSLPFNGRLVLLGHSIGASAALYAASQQHDIDAVISIAAFAHPREMMQRTLQRLPGFLIWPALLYVQWMIGHSFDKIAPINSVKKITCPILITHGSEDLTVPASDALQIHQANPRSQLITIPGADHGSVKKLQTHADLLIKFLKDNKIID